MLRDVVIHLHNEQPILADLAAEPTAGDVSLICTNLRTMGGKPPVFVERGDSTFVFPLAHVRFVEIRPAAVDQREAAGLADVVSDQSGTGIDAESDRYAQQVPEEVGDEVPTDDGLPLRRLTSVNGYAGETPWEPPAGLSGELEADDDDLLRRVREA
jgi:hypothetical protein